MKAPGTDALNPGDLFGLLCRRMGAEVLPEWGRRPTECAHTPDWSPHRVAPVRKLSSLAGSKRLHREPGRWLRHGHPLFLPPGRNDGPGRADLDQCLDVRAFCHVDGKGLGCGLGVAHTGGCAMIQTRCKADTFRKLFMAIPAGRTFVQIDMSGRLGQRYREIPDLSLDIHQPGHGHHFDVMLSTAFGQVRGQGCTGRSCWSERSGRAGSSGRRWQWLCRSEGHPARLRPGPGPFGYRRDRRRRPVRYCVMIFYLHLHFIRFLNRDRARRPNADAK